MTVSYSELADVAHEMADCAGAAILPYFRGDRLATESKAQDGYDPVTAADRAAERAMRDVLARRRPDDDILGEEYGATSGRSGLRWVLDPIDGTRGFVAGTPTWGVLIAAGPSEHPHGGPRLGLIDQPYIGERFIGFDGAAEMRGPHGAHPIRTRPDRALDRAILFTTFPEIGTPAERAAFQRVAGAVQLVRYGMDCYAYALLAAGQIDLVIEAGLQTYDIQAPLALIEAAGGIVTDWQGGPAHAGGQVIAAAGPGVHRAALDLLRAG